MGISTAGKKCPICGQWISTDAPRFASRRGSGARDVLQREYLGHLRTNHPDYLRWSRPYQLIGVGLVVSGMSVALIATALRSVLLLLLAILVTLVIGTPLFLIYRRKFKASKSHWKKEHPASSAS
jgi:hypothetical protein